MKKRCNPPLLLIFLLFCSGINAQNKSPYQPEMQAFKKADSTYPPAKGAIVFAGSSSFTYWKDVQDYFPGHTIINRGFGGSTLLDVIQFEEETILQYKPKQVVIYCGENDLAYNDSVTAKMVFQRFTRLFTDIRSRLPKVAVVYVSIKPSPSRWRLKEKMMEANALIGAFLAKKKKTAFADMWPGMLDVDGKPVESIFKEDKLHMNEKGYVIWARVLKPLLK